MPKETFYNLPKEKKLKIFQASVSEFSSRNFDEASLNNIVKAAGISKGSMYQYFEDKLDLFKFIIEEIGRAKSEVLTGQVETEDFFAKLRQMYSQTLGFAFEHPAYIQVLAQLEKQKGSPVYEAVLGDSMNLAEQYFEQKVIEAQHRGSISASVSPQVLAMLVLNINDLIVNELVKRIHLKTQNEMQIYVEQLIAIIENGSKK